MKELKHLKNQLGLSNQKQSPGAALEKASKAYVESNRTSTIDPFSENS